MKKASKILTLILVVVITASLLAGCAAFGKNTAKYRNSVAVKVGNENITIGKVLDTFNSYYNSYSAYINAGYLTADSLMSMVMSNLYYQAEKVDTYKNLQGVPVNAALKDVCKNAEYLTSDEMDYVISYVKYMVFSTVDSLVEDYIGEDFELKDAETADTSRDFTKLDGISSEDGSYAQYVYNQNFVNDEMDEYIQKYYKGLINTSDFNTDSYVYQNAAAAAKMLSDLNDRIEGETKLKFEDLKGYQEKALAQYKRNVITNYDFDLAQLVKNQVEDVVYSIIVAKYNLSINQVIEGDNIDATLTVLKSNLQVLIDSDTAKFNTDGDFINFIEGLSDGDYIHSVPQGYNYIFVKNVLVPFSEKQKAVLASAAKTLGTTDCDEYKQIREKLATKIVADDFLSDKDADGNYTTQVKDIFVMDGEKLAINPACKAFSDYLASDGSVVAMEGKTEDETVIELMKQFNTDTAQHTAAYDYVVRVGEVPSGYKAKWVTEFVDGANEAYELGEKSYALAVSEYGVHIIYYVSDVAAQNFDFSKEHAKWLDPSTNEYKLFKSYFESQSSLILGDKQSELHKSYVEAGKITKTANFDVFLSDNGIDFDFEGSLTDD